VTHVLLSKHLQNDVAANYATERNGKKDVKSTTVLLRNNEEEAIGALTINYDTEPVSYLQEILSDIGLQGEKPLDKMETVEKQYNNVQEMAQTFIRRIIGEADVEKMDRRKKLEIVASMEEKGVFLIRGALENVAEALQVSKVTIYSYLDDIRDRSERK
jgi:predicted transcriptional regulator YheO